jgi:hypothetical protein
MYELTLKMSAALSSARRRRAGPETVAAPGAARQTTPQSNFPGSQQPNMAVGLTLPQVIAVVDKRLTALEELSQSNNSSKEEGQVPNNVKEILDEFASRFDIIADELASMKDIIMKLQTYTMEVNKTLHEERIRILSDAPTPLEDALNSVH